MKRTLANPPRPRGFSLVEIMVALVVGMIGILVIMQVARTGEAQKRVTAGSGEAQNNVALGIYSVERDIRQAGYGFSSLNAIGCKLTVPERGGSLAALTLNVLAPILINNSLITGADAGTDTLLIVHGNGRASPEGDIISQVGIVGNARHLGLLSPINFQKNEWVAAAPAIPTLGCELTLGAVQSVYPECAAGSPAGSCPKPTTVVVPSAVSAQEDGRLFNFGSSPKIVGYAIRGGKLSACDYMTTDCSNAANWIVIANNIVSLRAQYGRLGSYHQTMPTPSGDQDVFASDLAFSSLRFALVARNDEWNKDEVTSSAPKWGGSPTSDDDDSGLPISLEQDGWKHYRYQVLETVVPLRNIPWMGS
jgi:type IV pilus assembly protein PilW